MTLEVFLQNERFIDHRHRRRQLAAAFSRRRQWRRERSVASSAPIVAFDWQARRRNVQRQRCQRNNNNNRNSTAPDFGLRIVNIQSGTLAPERRATSASGRIDIRSAFVYCKHD
jgi:hypothetical protein